MPSGTWGTAVAGFSEGVMMLGIPGAGTPCIPEDGAAYRPFTDCGRIDIGELPAV